MLCAICTSECDGSRRAPIGRNDAMVVICAPCDEQAPRADDGPDRSYEPTGGLLSYKESQRGIETALGADCRRLTKLENAVSLTPGAPLDAWELARNESAYEINRPGARRTVNAERARARNIVNRKARGL